MLVQYIDESGCPSGQRYVAFDCVNAGVGDLVIVCLEGGSVRLLMDNVNLAANMTICGMVDFYTLDTKVFSGFLDRAR
jgi:microcompartment protein CcmK/EutM